MLPFLAMSSPIALMSPFAQNLATFDRVQTAFAEVINPADFKTKEEIAIEALNKERAEKIDAYFKQRNMPLDGYGMKMIVEAEKNGLDWRLIPAISIKESTGGKFACDYNPFGWGSCKISFKSFDEAIEVVSRNLGGNNPKTALYYSGDTKTKLYHYNGKIIPTYTGEVLQFMELINEQKI